jgi:hypothetical protein
MESTRQFNDEATWSATEKKVSRRAFAKAFERHWSSITAEARRMLEKVTIGPQTAAWRTRRGRSILPPSVTSGLKLAS